MGRKSPKTHQREIPLETPCFYVCTGLGPKSALGLVGWLDGPTHLWAVSTPLAVLSPSTRTSSLGGAASPGRRRPGCATGRAETGRTVHQPSSDRAKESCVPSWYGNYPSARPGKQLLTAQNSGVDSTRRGKAPPLAGFRPFCPVKMDPSGAKNRLAGSKLTSDRGTSPPTRPSQGAFGWGNAQNTLKFQFPLFSLKRI